jgi:hypothetical protein
MATTLVTQSFGSENEYRRAIFAIWSYWVYCPQGKVLLFTDAPAYFAIFFKGQPIDYVLLTPDKIKEMRGEINFLHRMKISLIEEAFRSTNDNLLYIDSDTFFIADPTSLMYQVSDRKAFMHLREYHFDSLIEMKMPASKTFHAFLELINKTSFKSASGSPIHVSSSQYSWNAGAMMLHTSHAKLLPDVYALTDQFYPASQNHASEQYAFSIVLQNNISVESCDSAVYHYWYRVKKQIMHIFLTKRITDQWGQLSTEKKLEQVQQWVKILLNQFDSHILILRDQAIQSFNESHFVMGYKFSFRALLKNPFNVKFIKDVLYHTRSYLMNRHE